MTVRLVLLLLLGLALVVMALWGMRSRKKVKPGPHNNWAQRDGSELYSGNSIVDQEILWAGSDQPGGWHYGGGH
jgi:hypothetical protein